MKAKIASLLTALFILATVNISAQNTITVQAMNDEISNNLDLKAVAAAFGESRNLEDFEKRLNDYDSGISNLDLNGDGEVDYLRVIETSENNTHLIVIQAILGDDVYQDVATITVERDQDNRPTIIVTGDPYLYGYDYVFEPYYLHTPYIISWLWSVNYHRWFSPFRWRHYPRYYHYRQPIHLGLYLSFVRHHRSNIDYYRFRTNYKNERTRRMMRSMMRNDFAIRHPEHNFNTRHKTFRNKAEFERHYRAPERNNNRVNDRPVRNENTRINTGNESQRRIESNSRKNTNTRTRTQPANVNKQRTPTRITTPIRKSVTQIKREVKQVRKSVERTPTRVSTPKRTYVPQVKKVTKEVRKPVNRREVSRPAKVKTSKPAKQSSPRRNTRKPEKIQKQREVNNSRR